MKAQPNNGEHALDYDRNSSNSNNNKNILYIDTMQKFKYFLSLFGARECLRLCIVYLMCGYLDYYGFSQFIVNFNGGSVSGVPQNTRITTPKWDMPHGALVYNYIRNAGSFSYLWI